jgi:hypothetical protein
VLTDGVVVARGLLGAADIGDGPTDEQRSVITHLLHGYFGSDEPLPAELALQAMLSSATGFEQHFSAIDHLARVDDPLDQVRVDCGIPPRAA